jgi:hypothetical protein
VPQIPDEILSVKPNDLSILINSEGQLIYQSPINNHATANEASAAKGLNNVISITNGDKILRMYEFIGREDQTLQVILGPGVTFTKW